MNSSKFNLSTIIAATAVICVPAVNSFADDDWDWGDENVVSSPDQPLTSQAQAAPAASNSYVSVEAFFAGATDDIYCEDKGLNIGGIWLTIGAKNEINPNLKFDYAGIFAFGAGSLEVDTHWGSYYRTEDKFVQGDLFAGAQIGLDFQVSDSVAIGIGAMGGLDIRYLSYETSGYGYKYDQDADNTAVGFFFGAYARLDWQLSERWALTASARYMCTTTENDEIERPWGETVELDSCNYVVGTVGLRFSF